MFPEYPDEEQRFYDPIYDPWRVDLLQRIQDSKDGYRVINEFDADEFNFWSRLTEDGYTGGDTEPWGGCPAHVWLTSKGEQYLAELKQRSKEKN